MRYSLLNSIRLGKVLRSSSMITMTAHEEWVTPVAALLTDHGERADVERFLAETALNPQIAVLEKILEKYPDDT